MLESFARYIISRVDGTRLPRWAQTLTEWWAEKGQLIYASKAAFARAAGVSYPAVKFYFRGVNFPRRKHCDALYSLTRLDCFSADARVAIAAEHERMIPRAIRKARRLSYLSNPEQRRARSRISWRKRYDASKRRVTPEELDVLRGDPRLRKDVCRNCGEIYRDVGPHLAHCTVAKMAVFDYKEKWGFLRSRNATRSPETQARQSAAMKRARHQPPAWTHRSLPEASSASLRTNRPGSARLEERLAARSRRLPARPQLWKRTSGGGLITDAKIAQLRLRGQSVDEIAVATGMSSTGAFQRLRRMGFPRRARFFLHGEPITGATFATLVSDFGLDVEDAARRVGLTLDWAKRLMRGKGRHWVKPEIARSILKARKQLLNEFRSKASAGSKGGRPKQLTPSEERKLPERYEALRLDLRALREFIRSEEKRPSLTVIWDWLCSGFRSARLRALQLSPGFFDWVSRDYEMRAFQSGDWRPRDLAISFVAADFDVKENFVADFLSHYESRRLHQSGAILQSAEAVSSSL